MLGLFGSLNMAARSLSVESEATAVAGHNLANVNNSAYARQKLNIQSSTSLPTPIGDEGNGIDAVSITQVRDGILDNAIQSEGSVSGSLTAQQNALEDAESSLGEQLSSTTSTGATAPASTTGLTNDLSNLFGSFQSLSVTASSLPLRQSAVQSAQAVAGQFNSVSSGLTSIRSNINTSISSDVAASNQDLSDIADLNKQIIYAQATGNTANDLIDLRQQKIEDLSSKVDLTTTSQTNGSLDVSIGGVTMVSGAKTPDSLEAYDAGGGQVLVRAQTAGTTLSLSGGSMAGNIDVRDGALSSLQSSLNTLASQVISNVNSIYSAGYDLNGNTGQNLFTGADAASIGVNATVVSDPSTFQAAGKANAPSDNTVALALGQLGNKSLSGLNNQTISQSYATTVGNLGSALATVNEKANTNSSVAQMLSGQRSSNSGVSVDDEMTSIIQFQKAYTASAELITTLNQMLETVVTMKTV